MPIFGITWSHTEQFAVHFRIFVILKQNLFCSIWHGKWGMHRKSPIFSIFLLKPFCLILQIWQILKIFRHPVTLLVTDSTTPDNVTLNWIMNLPRKKIPKLRTLVRRGFEPGSSRPKAHTLTAMPCYFSYLLPNQISTSSIRPSICCPWNRSHERLFLGTFQDQLKWLNFLWEITSNDYIAGNGSF